MDDRKELTKELIASGVKELMLSMSFEKITIRMIAEKAGIIRPTFYYHFQDKYEVLEWIVRSELLEPIKYMLDKGMLEESQKYIFSAIEADREFYKRAFDITGQNSFWEIVITCIKDFFISYTTLDSQNPNLPESLTPELVALHHAFNLAAMIQIWLRKTPHLSADEVVETYRYLNGTTLADILDSGFFNPN